MISNNKSNPILIINSRKIHSLIQVSHRRKYYGSPLDLTRGLATHGIRAGPEVWVAQTRPKFGCSLTIEYLKNKI